MRKHLVYIIFFLISVVSVLPVTAQNKGSESINLLLQQRPDSALSVLRKKYNIALEKNDRVNEGLSLQQMGSVCYNQGHYSQAMDFYLHADSIFSELNKPDLLAANMGEMGVLYYYNKQLDKAQQVYNRALSLYNQTGNLKGQAQILGNIGHLFEKKSKYDSAFHYQQSALQKYTQAGFKQGAAKIYENLGSIYEDLEKYDSAYVSFSQSLKLYKEENNETGSIEVVNNLGDILRKTGKYSESLVQTRIALQLSEKTGNMYQLASACRDLGRTYALMSRLDSAYYWSELSRKYSLDVYSADGAKQTTFLQVLYDINKKSDEIARLNNIRKVNRITGVAVAVVIVLLIVLGVVIFSRQRFKLRVQTNQATQKAAEHEVVMLELKNQQLEESSLKQQLDVKSRELSTHTLNLIQNNQFLEHLRGSLQAMVKDDKRDQKKQMQQLIGEINESFNHEQHWKEFTVAFEQVHQEFFHSLKAYSTQLTSTDMRLIALLKMNLDSADIATLLGISTDSLRVSRYRLRKKLNMAQGDNLSAFVQKL